MSEREGGDGGSFYDDIAEYFDLIYVDWEGSMRRQGAAIAAVLDRDPSQTRILDITAGIGTQALPLASLGYEVVARDLSSRAIQRLLREASSRGLRIDAAPAAMQEVVQTVDGRFDAILSLDNSIPHLLTDDEIVATLERVSTLLEPSGVVLLSVRDYEMVDRSSPSMHPYPEHVRDGRRYRMIQEWEWYDGSRYRTTMIVETQGTSHGWHEVLRTQVSYYALPIPRLLDLMRAAGLDATLLDDHGFFQPLLKGSAV